MKPLPMLLLNLAIVGAAFVIYDQVRGEPQSVSVVMEGGADTTALGHVIKAYTPHWANCPGANQFRKKSTDRAS